ncbi:MAG: hypothetical protein IKO56_04570, partial [Alphaproteobacteria bacterium]|nr:hypothetical protein [Alphaproteobacteria bacterium]
MAENEQTNSSDNSKDDLKDLYKRYCDCRDQEIENFWKKTTYIWTLLTVCFTAYGLLVSNKMNSNYFLFYNSITCFLGITLSFIWLWMAKATKAWYEVYEMAIWEIDNFGPKCEHDNQYMIQNFWSLKTKEDFAQKSRIEKMFSTRDFSPSKIVIAIGWILISFWVMAAICGILLTYAKPIWSLLSNFEITSSDLFRGIVKFILYTLPLWALILLTKYIYPNIKSSTLRDYSAQELFKHIKNDSEIQKLQLYFEVKDNEVCFWTTDSDVIKKINEHYHNISPCHYYSNKTSYDFNLVNTFYVDECDDSEKIKDVKSKFEKKKINVKDVKIFDNVLYINFE